MFGKKKVVVEIDLTRITKLEQDLGILQLDVERLKTHLNSLRGLVNKKLSHGGLEEDEQIESSKYNQFPSK